MSTTSAAAPPADVETEAPACEVSCGGAATVTAAVHGPDYHAEAVANVDEVFASMQGDLVACYKNALRRDPDARAFVQLDIVLGPDGSVWSVFATGGGRLGDAGMRCLTKRVERAHFAPVHGGGTLRVEVPLTFRRLGPDET